MTRYQSSDAHFNTAARPPLWLLLACGPWQGRAGAKEVGVHVEELAVGGG